MDTSLVGPDPNYVPPPPPAIPSPTIISFFPEGSYTVTVTGYDLAGNSNAGTVSLTFDIDTTSPTLVLEQSDADGIVKNTDTVVVTATFSEAMQATPTLYMGSLITNQEMTATASSAVWIHSIDLGGLSVTDGSYQVTVTGSDLVGNVYTDTDSLTIVVDTISPTISNILIESSNATTTFAIPNDVVTLTFNVDEAVTGLSADDVKFRFTDGMITLPYVTDADSVSLTGTNTIVAVYTLTSTDTAHDFQRIEWDIITSGFTDLAGNFPLGSGINADVDSNGLTIRYDNVAPTLGTVTINSDNSSDNEKAIDGDTIIIDIWQVKNWYLPHRALRL